MPMKFRLSAPSAPFLNIGTNGVSLQPVVDIQAYAIYPNGNLAPLFLLGLVSWGPGLRWGHWARLGSPSHSPSLTWCPVSTACTSVSKGGSSRAVQPPPIVFGNPVPSMLCSC